jgi:hypothetical protein
MYEVELCNGHCVICGDNRQKYLVDTGSPFSLAKSGEIGLFNQRFQASKALLGVSLKQISSFVGTEIDGLIGADILENTEIIFDFLYDPALTFYLNGNRPNSAFACHELFDGRGICIGNHKGLMAKLEIVGSVPIINAKINNQDVKLFLDSGAKLSYIHPSFVANIPSEGKESDFNPMYGDFETNTYTLTTNIVLSAEIGGITKPIKYGVLPELLQLPLQMTGVQGVVGYGLLKDCITSVDYQNKAFCIYPLSHPR